MHSMYISEWADEFEWSSLTFGLWDVGLVWVNGDESWGSAWVGGSLHLQKGILNASVVPTINIVKLGSSDYIYSIEKLQAI